MGERLSIVAVEVCWDRAHLSQQSYPWAGKEFYSKAQLYLGDGLEMGGYLAVMLGGRLSTVTS